MRVFYYRSAEVARLWLSLCCFFLAIPLLVAEDLPQAQRIDLLGKAPQFDGATYTFEVVTDKAPHVLSVVDGQVLGSAEPIITAWQPDFEAGTFLLQLVDAEAIEGKLLPITKPVAPPNYALEGRWWRIKPESHDQLFQLIHMGKEIGLIRQAPRPGFWNMGQEHATGIRFAFFLGDQPQNWNFVRLARLSLGKLDLSSTKGLQLSITTEVQQPNLPVSLWVRETDGSWYYVKHGPWLGREASQATIYWRDFEEAEWVSPGNHMDEDYVLDLENISEIGIGLIDPDGSGKVEFTL